MSISILHTIPISNSPYKIHWACVHLGALGLTTLATSPGHLKLARISVGPKDHHSRCSPDSHGVLRPLRGRGHDTQQLHILFEIEPPNKDTKNSPL